MSSAQLCWGRRSEGTNNYVIRPVGDAYKSNKILVRKGLVLWTQFVGLATGWILVNASVSLCHQYSFAEEEGMKAQIIMLIMLYVPYRVDC